MRVFVFLLAIHNAIIGFLSHKAHAFATPGIITTKGFCVPSTRIFSQEEEQNESDFSSPQGPQYSEGSSGEEEEEEEEEVQISSVKIDDGGSDLTDRFKYKVNALMGVFDPQGTDDERQDGNILNAMLTFPVKYSFNVVGRTNGDNALREQFIEQVKEVLGGVTGDKDDLECQITPRGKNFTKVIVQARVESAAMISTAYQELEALDMTIMRF